VTPRRPRIRFTLFLYTGALLLLTALFFHRLALTGDLMGRGDALLYFTPYWHLRAEALRGAASLLWTPDLFMGVPVLANSQIGALYPPNWPLTLFSAPVALKLSLMLHAFFAALGAFALARTALDVSRMSALAAGLAFAFSGYLGAQTEHVNQFQGLAWLPWLLLILHVGGSTTTRPGFAAGALGLAGALALQFLTGHTQTVFISIVGLGIVALATRRVRPVALLACAGLLAAPLIAPQLIPTLELSAQSVRAGGLPVNEAVSFSLSPFVIGRGLLPAYDGLLFTEYIGYIGVIGLGLAALGGFNGGAKRWPWLLLCAAGLLLALGAYNPLYLLLANLPPLNLFRVPARWLALAVLGGAMLVALGVETFHRAGYRQQGAIGFGVIILVCMAYLAGQSGTPDVPVPNAVTLLGWAVALTVFFGLIRFFSKRDAIYLPVAACLALGIELFAASLVLPHNQTVQADALADTRFTAAQVRVLNEPLPVAGRTLTLSDLTWDTYDLGAITRRYQDGGYSALSLHSALTAAKAWDALRANLGLMVGVPTADGFDGGLLPLLSYADFSARLTPDGLPVADGRLIEALSIDACGAACVPDAGLLAQMNVRWLILDKTHDVFADELAYDVGLPMREAARYQNIQGFTLTEIHVLYMCDSACESGLALSLDGLTPDLARDDEVQGYRLAVFASDEAIAPETVDVRLAGAVIHAVTLVDARTRAFQQLAPLPFTRVLSSELKVYEHADARYAFLADESGAMLAGDGVRVLAQSDEGETLSVSADQPRLLVVSGADYPGWSVTVNGESADIVRHLGFFRAVQVPAGDSTVVFTYAPPWWPMVPLAGGVAWVGWLAALVVLWATRPSLPSSSAPAGDASAEASGPNGRPLKVSKLRLR
jgi:hypothetical protein